MCFHRQNTYSHSINYRRVYKINKSSIKWHCSSETASGTCLCVICPLKFKLSFYQIRPWPGTYSEFIVFLLSTACPPFAEMFRWTLLKCSPNAAQGVRQNVAQDGSQNAAQVDGQNVISASRTRGSTNCTLECWCTRPRIWGEYSCLGRLMYIYVVMNCGQGFTGVHLVGWIFQMEKLGRGLRMFVWVQIVFELWARFRCSRTMNPRLSSNCFELWERFHQRAFCRRNRSGGKAWSRTTNACLSSNCFWTVGEISPVEDDECLFELNLFWTVGEVSEYIS